MSVLIMLDGGETIRFDAFRFLVLGTDFTEHLKEINFLGLCWTFAVLVFYFFREKMINLRQFLSVICTKLSQFFGRLITNQHIYPAESRTDAQKVKGFPLVLTLNHSCQCRGVFVHQR